MNVIMFPIETEIHIRTTPKNLLPAPKKANIRGSLRKIGREGEIQDIKRKNRERNLTKLSLNK